MHQFNEILKERDYNQNKTVPLNLQQVNAIMKKKKYYENWDEMEQFSMCHHCKYIFHRKYLLDCKNKEHNQCQSNIQNDPYNYTYSNKAMRTKSYDLHSRRQFNNQEQKNNKSQKCYRQYCQYCLRNSYDIRVESIKTKEWICPFCQVIHIDHSRIFVSAPDALGMT